MKEVQGKEVSEDAVQEDAQQEATKVTYSIEDMNELLAFLSQQKYAEVAGLVELLKTKGELS
tara:strand:+ start:1881 stop:2066 length:186 start_codon:yes stop_codon:yes gene_type:complete